MGQTGLDCKIYHNTGNYASPTWSEITSAMDVTLNLSAAEADASSRASNWRQTLTALLDGSVDFDIVADNTDTAYEALRDAFLNRTAIDMAIMDGPIATNGSEGLRAEMSVVNFTRNEPLEDTMTVSVSVKPAPTGNDPAWMEVGS